MVKKKGDLTPVATRGYNGEGAANPYLYSSPNWYAYEIGAYRKRIGASKPEDVRMGRGYQIHANGALYGFDRHNAVFPL